MMYLGYVKNENKIVSTYVIIFLTIKTSKKMFTNSIGRLCFSFKNFLAKFGEICFKIKRFFELINDVSNFSLSLEIFLTN